MKSSGALKALVEETPHKIRSKALYNPHETGRAPGPAAPSWRQRLCRGRGENAMEHFALVGHRGFG